MKHNIKKQAIRRLKILAGQINGLGKMINNEKYCIDIITQSLAIKEGLSSLENLILENHLSIHVIEQMKSDKSDKAIKEILKIYKLSKKK